MIRSFADEQTRRVFARERVRAFGSELQRSAWKKLAALHAAGSLQDLRVPPGNRLEKLTGRREGQHSIRINEQWRICFEWRAGNAYAVEIADYH
ncbi:MAG: type II toxin-antitoxin system RelE/ParE family toxin [Spirochaetaceae bacterium]|nr:MAG: type II toxin-antitoxin system RelE/ParE family toxin [Spirochaetaceae bacterium]